jgi:acyl-CoA synthetase (AMP-forming)/AMP-acid ligase II
MAEQRKKLYELSTGGSVTALSPFSSPLDEYRAAFQNREQPFLNHYTFEGRNIQKRSLTRGDFWDLACSAGAYLAEMGLAKGDRVVHFFSHNSLYDLIFRLGAVLVGCVPVTVNWQADSDETVLYKAKVSKAKLLVYDKSFADRVAAMKSRLVSVLLVEAERIEHSPGNSQLKSPPLSFDDERIIVFTSGTTGRPKGASLPHRSYLANRLTFEQYFGASEKTQIDLLLVNPLHHANSTAFSDWAMRRAGTRIHLVQRYATLYWKILAEVAASKGDLLIAPMVSRHIDFLENLSAQSELPVAGEELKKALSQTEMMIGSAPVGPATVKRLLKFAERLPGVRFGSTETCLEVMATPRTMSKERLLEAFEAGWSHRYQGEPKVGYYIGRDHQPFTQVKVVKSIDPESKTYFQPCEIGEPGYLVTRGPNLMSHYVGDARATSEVFQEGWYTGLRDIAFALRNKEDGQLDYYWMSRDSALIIRGGANYACDQVAAELSEVLTEDFRLKPEQFRLAVVGLRVESEHEDSCCVTIDLGEEAADRQPQLEADFIEKARERVSKGARPDYVCFAKIPLSFKGEIRIPELKQDFKQLLKQKGLALHE